MANFREVAQWIADVYRLATTDPVLGGDENAPDNKGLFAVVCRTAYLKQELDKVKTELANRYFIGQIIELANYNSADYDTTGLGKAGTPAEHWALCNGKNDTIDKRGLLTAGLDPNSSDYQQPGQTGGRNSITLSTGQLPAHSHKAGFKITDSGAEKPYRAARNSAYGADGTAIQTENTGNGEAIDVRNKFVTSIFIQRISN